MINDNLEQQAQAIFKSWFVDFEPFGGVMPSDWKKTTLGEVTKPIRDRVKDKPCTVLSAINTGILQPSEDYFTKQVFSKDISKYIVVEKYDFAYNPSRVNIGSIGINDYEFIGCVSPVYVVFRTEKHYHNFMNFHIKTSNFKEEVKTRASGSVRQAMNYTDFSLIEVVYPNLNTVIKFNEIYDAIKNTIKHNVFENQKLAKLRDTLLPRLMSGEIDVSQVES